MLMKILGLLEVIFALVIGLHLLHGTFERSIVFLAIGYIFLRGAIFAISSKDFASIIDLLFGIYAILAIFGIFSHYTVTIALMAWFAQKGIFSLVLGN